MMGMRIVNRRRFTIFCMILVMLVGLLGYGVYCGGLWLITTITFHFQDAELSEIDEKVNLVMMSVEANSLIEELEWLSRFVLGCEASVLVEEGIANLTLNVLSKTALNYYPIDEMSSRIYKQTLKLLKDISKMKYFSELNGLNVLYVDSRFITHENPIGEVISLSFDQHTIHDMNWDNVTWLSLEDYKN